MSWLWIVGGLSVWLVAGVAMAMLIGRGIRMADERAIGGRASRAAVTRRSASAVAAAGATSSTRRRALPLPPVAIALLVTAVGLVTVGFVLQSTGATGTTARLLSMNGADSLPRLFVASLFAVASLMAFAGAARLRERRIWWAGVGLVSGTIAAVKFASPVHAVDYQKLVGAVGTGGAALLGAVTVAVVAGSLWLASRSDQRDRMRVLGALGLYAAAALGVAAGSTLMGVAHGSGTRWALAATYVEEAGQAVGSVALLVAVLAGVAPRLVLPADWALRRAADAHTLEVSDSLAGRAGVGDARL